MLATAWFNWRMWRRMRAAKAERAGWTVADFDSQLVANGIDPAVPPVVRALVADLYGDGVAPHPDDDFARFLAIDTEEVEDIVASAYARLGIAPPSRDRSEHLPPIKDLRDLADHLDRRLKDARA